MPGPSFFNRGNVKKSSVHMELGVVVSRGGEAHNDNPVPVAASKGKLVLETPKVVHTDTMVQLITFLTEPIQHTAFDGHDMIQRFVCALYQRAYPKLADPRFTLGKIDINCDTDNAGKLVHDLLHYYVYNHSKGLNFGLESFAGIVTAHLQALEQDTANNAILEKLSKKDMDDLTNAICSKFLTLAEKYLDEVRKIIVSIDKTAYFSCG